MPCPRAQAYLSEIVRTYDNIRRDDVHLFLQGGSDELRVTVRSAGAERPVRRYSSGADIMDLINRIARRRDLGFASLSGRVVRPLPMCSHEIIVEGVHRKALGIDCTKNYSNPVRAARPSMRALNRARVHASRAASRCRIRRAAGARVVRRVRSADPRDAAPRVGGIPPHAD